MYAVRRQAGVCPRDGLCSVAYLPSPGGQVSRRPQCSHLHVPGSVLEHGIRADHFPGESAGHRGVLGGACDQGLSPGAAGPLHAQQPGRCQRALRLSLHCEFAQALIRIARRLYATEPLGLELDNTVYALDSTTIELCLTLFPWAPFRSTKATIKLHTLLDRRGTIPSFIHISDGKWHDVKVLDLLIPEAGAFYVMDRGYLDFARLYALHQSGGFFVTRARRNMNFQRVHSTPIDRSCRISSDWTHPISSQWDHRLELLFDSERRVERRPCSQERTAMPAQIGRFSMVAIIRVLAGLQEKESKTGAAL